MILAISTNHTLITSAGMEIKAAPSAPTPPNNPQALAATAETAKVKCF